MAYATIQITQGVLIGGSGESVLGLDSTTTVVLTDDGGPGATSYSWEIISFPAPLAAAPVVTDDSLQVARVIPAPLLDGLYIVKLIRDDPVDGLSVDTKFFGVNDEDGLSLPSASVNRNMANVGGSVLAQEAGWFGSTVGGTNVLLDAFLRLRKAREGRFRGLDARTIHSNPLPDGVTLTYLVDRPHQTFTLTGAGAYTIDLSNVGATGGVFWLRFVYNAGAGDVVVRDNGVDTRLSLTAPASGTLTYEAEFYFDGINWLLSRLSSITLTSNNLFTRDAGGFIYPTVVTDSLVLGGTTPVGSELLRVVGSSQFEGDLVVPPQAVPAGSDSFPVVFKGVTSGGGRTVAVRNEADAGTDTYRLRIEDDGANFVASFAYVAGGFGTKFGISDVGLRLHTEAGTELWSVSPGGQWVIINLTTIKSDAVFQGPAGGWAAPTYSFIADPTTGLAWGGSGRIYIFSASERVAEFGNEFTLRLDQRQWVGGGGPPCMFKAVGAAHTALTASTEVPDVVIDLDRTVQFEAGNFALQRAVQVKAPTYSATGATVIDEAATLDISGAPQAGANVAITSPLAIRVTGNSRLGGQVSITNKLIMSNVAPTTMGDIGMDTTTGRPQAYIGGAARNLAYLEEISAGTDLAVVQARRTTDYTTTAAFANVTLDTTDVENYPLVVDHDDVNRERIIARSTGLYRIAYNFTVVPTSAGTFETKLVKNDLTDLPGSYQLTQDGNDYNAAGNEVLVLLSAGEYVTFRARYASGAAHLRNVAVTATLLQGVQGIQGIPGSGSSLTIKDEGVNVPNTPHSALNFVGPGVAVTDGGGGNATVTITGSAAWTQVGSPGFIYPVGGAGQDVVIGALVKAGTEKFRVYNGAVLFDAPPGSASTPVSGAGIRLMWIPAKAAFRAGGAVGTDWDDANIGSYSVAFGLENKASGTYSFCMGRYSHAEGSYSIALGNYAQALASDSIALGYHTEVESLADDCIAIGAYCRVYDEADGGGVAIGRTAYVRARYAMATGHDSNATLRGAHTHAACDIAVHGDAQSSLLVPNNRTADATPTDLLLDGVGGSSRLVLPNDTSWAFDILLVARRTEVDGENSAWRFQGLIIRNATAASTTLLSLSTTVIYNTGAWGADVSADTTNGALRIRVTGEAGKVIYWVASTRTVETTG